MYCDLIDTGKTFNNKKIYRCKKCGLEAGLEDPSVNILCFVKNMEAYKSIYAEQETHKNLYLDPEVKGFLEGANELINNDQQQQIENHDNVLATKEEIDKRISICNQCEYYKDDACMLCGCRVVREKNYQNKLANKNASCPDGRWGPINT